MAELQTHGTESDKLCAVLIDEMKYDFKLPILIDSKTETYVKISKIMLFIRASTNLYRACINKLKEKYKENCFVSRGDCLADGARHFQTEAGDCVDLTRPCCRDRVKRNCLQGKNLIIIDTSQFGIGDVKYFSCLAKQLQYVIIVDPWKTGQKTNPRNRISPFIKDTDVKHCYFGWFLNSKDSLSLREEVILYIKDCTDEIDQFTSMLHRCNALPNVADHYRFGMPIQEQVLAYCLTKYCDSNYLLSYNYLSKLAAENAYGRVTNLIVFAFIVSPHVVGAKIKLKYKQKIFKQIDIENVQINAENLVGHGAPLTPEEVSLSPPSVSKSTLESTNSEYYDPSQAILGHGQSAIIKLGHSAHVSHPQALCLLSDAINREVNASKGHSSNVDIINTNRSLIRRYGQFWIIYLKELLSVDAIMASEIVFK